jgi:hypothetical protein
MSGNYTALYMLSWMIVAFSEHMIAMGSIGAFGAGPVHGSDLTLMVFAAAGFFSLPVM